MDECASDFAFELLSEDPHRRRPLRKVAAGLQQLEPDRCCQKRGSVPIGGRDAVRGSGRQSGGTPILVGYTGRGKAGDQKEGEPLACSSSEAWSAASDIRPRNPEVRGQRLVVPRARLGKPGESSGVA